MTEAPRAARILMVAPVPVFTPRGTPIAILNRCRALSLLGHRVDLITYPIGEDVPVPNLRYLRGPAIPGLASVKVGPSPAKLPLNAGLLLPLLRHLRRGRYDVLHTHEEAGLFGAWLHRRAGVPHVHDLHNDLAMATENYGYSARHPFVRFAGWLEGRIISTAATTIVIYPDLAELVQRHAPSTPVHVVHNVALEPPADSALVGDLRRAWAPAGEPLVVYTGTLEPYQGIDVLLEGFAAAGPWDGGAAPRLVVVGGRDDQIAELRPRAAGLGVGERVVFTGLRPPGEIPACMAAADVLVSARSTGSNIPLKIYSYLRAGKPIVATDIRSHTQVLDETTAVLVDYSPTAIAAGLTKVVSDPAFGRDLGAAAARTAADRYSPTAYLHEIARCYADVGFPAPDLPDLEAMAATLDSSAASPRAGSPGG